MLTKMVCVKKLEINSYIVETKLCKNVNVQVENGKYRWYGRESKDEMGEVLKVVKLSLICN